MVVWSGRGILSILVLILAIFICVSIFPKDWSDIGFSISLFVAAIFSFVFGMKWNTTEVKDYIDKQTNKEVGVLANHSLFWIKMQYWSIIFLVMQLAIISSNLNTTGIEFVLYLVLAVLAVVCLMFFGWVLFKRNFGNSEEFTANNKAEKKAFEVNPKFIKEDLKEIKSSEEDHNRFIPK